MSHSEPRIQVHFHVVKRSPRLSFVQVERSTKPRASAEGRANHSSALSTEDVLTTFSARLKGPDLRKGLANPEPGLRACDQFSYLPGSNRGRRAIINPRHRCRQRPWTQRTPRHAKYIPAQECVALSREARGESCKQDRALFGCVPTGIDRCSRSWFMQTPGWLGSWSPQGP
jgi:hypothetical protein